MIPSFTTTVYVSTTRSSSSVLAPVLQLNCHSCQGQVMISPLNAPCPSGPPACGQIPPKQCSSPFALQTAYGMPPAETSVISPGGSLSRDVTLTRAISLTIPNPPGATPVARGSPPPEPARSIRLSGINSMQRSLQRLFQQPLRT